MSPKCIELLCEHCRCRLHCHKKKRNEEHGGIEATGKRPGKTSECRSSRTINSSWDKKAQMNRAIQQRKRRKTKQKKDKDSIGVVLSDFWWRGTVPVASNRTEPKWTAVGRWEAPLPKAHKSRTLFRQENEGRTPGIRRLLKPAFSKST